jgi:hypothetical protein
LAGTFYFNLLVILLIAWIWQTKTIKPQGPSVAILLLNMCYPVIHTFTEHSLSGLIKPNQQKAIAAISEGRSWGIPNSDIKYALEG